MNNFIKNVIEETFASKSQQKYFYAKSNDKSLSPEERKKWKKRAGEYYRKTNFDSLPDKVNNEEEIEEIVDEKGNIMRSKKPINMKTKGTTSAKTSDEFLKAVGNSMGNFGTTGVQNYRKYWGESRYITKGELLEVELGDNLGADETILKDKSYDEAYKYFTHELGLDREVALEKMKDLGYNKELPKDKIIVIETPKKYIEEYIDELLSTKNKNDDLVSNIKNDDIEINPIIKRQIESLKKSIKTYGLNGKLVYKKLMDNE
jgi:hypothetical protein